MVTDKAGDLRAEELCALTQVEPGRRRVSWGPRPCVSQEGRVGGHEGQGRDQEDVLEMTVDFL